MGMFSDVILPIEELLQPAQELQQSLIRDKIMGMLREVNETLVELNLRAIYTAFKRWE